MEQNETFQVPRPSILSYLASETGHVVPIIDCFPISFAPSSPVVSCNLHSLVEMAILDYGNVHSRLTAVCCFPDFHGQSSSEGPRCPSDVTVLPTTTVSISFVFSHTLNHRKGSIAFTRTQVNLLRYQ